jgi:hypothetical protein
MSTGLCLNELSADPHALDPRESSDDLLDYSIGEIFLLGIGPKISELTSETVHTDCRYDVRWQTRAPQ